MLDLTVIVPTVGRATLARTLASVGRVSIVNVVADGQEAFDSALRIVNETPSRAGTTIIARTDQTNALGHPQRNFAVECAATKWLAFMDDDDAYTPDAFQHIEANLNGREVPHIFQMRYGQHPHAPPGLVLWQSPSLHYGNVGTPMFIVPNLPGRLGVWPSQVGGDYAFIAETCALQGDPVWVPEVIADIRPEVQPCR